MLVRGGLLHSGEPLLDARPLSAKRRSFMDSFQTALTPEPEMLYKYHSAAKQKGNVLSNVLFECFRVPVPVVWQLSNSDAPEHAAASPPATSYGQFLA